MQLLWTQPFLSKNKFHYPQLRKKIDKYYPPSIKPQLHKTIIFLKRKKNVPVQTKNLTFGGTASFNFIYCVYLLELYKEEKFNVISHQRIPTQPHKCNRSILTVA